MLGVDDDWTDAYELGLLTRVFNQDVYNLPRVQEGLSSGAIDEVVFARYQETKIRTHARRARPLARQAVTEWVRPIRHGSGVTVLV